MTQRAATSRGPAPKGTRKPAAGRAAMGVVRGVVAAASRRPGIVLASMAVIGGGGLFTWNATMKQSARHPAPLFAPTAPASTASIAPEPPRKPDFTTGSTTPARQEGTAPRAAEGSGRATASADPIGGLIRGGEASTTPRAAEPKPGPKPRVVSAQKALVKLGYGPITADGLIGTTTRQAIEKFERDRKLPVTGLLGERTVRQLASLSGIALN